MTATKLLPRVATFATIVVLAFVGFTRAVAAPPNTPADTATDTPMDTPTNTATDTPTNTPMDTPTDTPVDTPTDTPTYTPTPLPTDTACDNDDFASASSCGLVIEPLPFTDFVNTSEATTAPDDPDCFGQGSTVWYFFIPSQDMRVEANTFGSDYDTTLSVYVGSPGDPPSPSNLFQVACNDDAGGPQSRVFYDAVATQVVWIMVGAFGSGQGGNLVFTVNVASPSPVSEFRVDPVGSFDRNGNATIHGTVTCTRPVFVFLFGTLTQRVGRGVVQGFFFTPLGILCDREIPWQVTVTAQYGRFAGGQAKASVDFEADAFPGSAFASVLLSRRK